MITYEQAVEVVRAHLEGVWTDELGTLWIEEQHGRANDEYFWVPYGADEWINAGNWDFALVDPHLMFVDRETSELVVMDQFQGHDIIDGMVIL